MSTRIDWPNHLVSFILIVASILMAFQLERCSTDHREDRLVNRHLQEIEEETQFNIQQIKLAKEQLEAYGQRLDTLLYLITSTDDTRRINQQLFASFNLPILYIKQNAYQSFTATGDIRYMDDFDRKANLVTLHEFYKETEAINQLLLDMYQDQYFAYIQEHLDLYRAQAQPLERYRERRFVNGISSVRYFINRCTANLAAMRARAERYLAGEAVAEMPVAQSSK